MRYRLSVLLCIVICLAGCSASSSVIHPYKMDELSKVVAKNVASMKKQEVALADLIPDVHKWHKQFTLAELQGAKDAVSKKILDIQVKTGNDLAAQKKMMEKEMKYVSDPSFLKPHTLHKTWEVAQQAYMKQIALVDEAIAWQPVEQALASIKSYSVANPKSTKIAKLVSEAEKIKAQNEASAKSHAKAAQKKKIAKLTQEKNDLEGKLKCRKF